MTWYSNMPAKRLIFVDDLEVWVIEKKRNKRANLRVQPDGRVEMSVPHAYPDSLVRDFVREKHDWIVRAQAKYANSPRGQAATATPQEVRVWRSYVEAFVPALVERWEPVLGVKAGKLAYRKMKSRWGSCQPSTGRICINVALALYPIECLEYVVVHELCHILQHNHSAAFWREVKKILPDYREREGKIRTFSKENEIVTE